MNPQQRFKLIMDRQSGFEWGDQYTPSVLAVPGEAPKGSRCCRLNSRLLGRTLHLMSQPERVFAQLALYHPALIDLHEQKMLWPINSCHPLRGHPLMREKFPRPVRGTMDIALEIGMKHYEIVNREEDGSVERIPFPYQGDLLLYLNGPHGAYAINWTVKGKKEAFGEKRIGRAKTPVQQKKDRLSAKLRTSLEEIYYASAGIRTVQVSLDLLETVAIQNLRLLFPMHDRLLTLEEGLLAEFDLALKEAVVAGLPPAELAIKYGSQWDCRDQFICRIYQKIWSRDIPVGLLDPILIDHPLSTDGRDALLEYGALFEELAS